MFYRLVANLLVSTLVAANMNGVSARVVQVQHRNESAAASSPTADQEANESRTSGIKGARGWVAEREGPAYRAALELLPQLLDQARGFEEQEREKPLTRLVIQAQIADILWNHDRVRARDLFVETFNDAALSNAARVSHGKRIQIRNDILNYLLKHDRRLAERLAVSGARVTAGAPRDNPFHAYDTLKEQSNLYLRIAMGLTKSDPERAARLFKDSLNGWLGSMHIEALRALRNRSPELADQLFVRAMSMVTRNPLYATTKIILLAFYVFPIVGIRPAFPAGQPQNPGLTPFSPKTIVPFLKFVHETLSQQSLEVLAKESPDSEMYRFASSSLRELIPYFEQYLPDKSFSVRERIENVIAETRRSGNQNPLTRLLESQAEELTGNVQELVAKAEDVQEQSKKDQLYLHIAGLLVMRDRDFDQALFFLQMVRDETQRRKAAPFVTMGALNAALLKGDAEKAYRYVKDEPESWWRAALLVLVANEFVAKSEHQRAKKLLKEAEESFGKPDNQTDEDYGPTGRVKWLIVLADVAVLIDPSLGFMAMNSAVEADNIDDAGRWSNQAFDLTEGKLIITGMSRYDRNQSFSWLARADYELAISLAKKIKDKEASVAAQLAVCRGILDKSIAPHPIKYSGFR